MDLHKNVKLLMCICAILPVMLFAGCTDKGYVADKISVMGIDVGGKSYAEAVECLKSLTLSETEEVSVNAEGIVFNLTAGEIGAVYDAQKTADYLMEKSKGVFSGWFSKKYDPVVTVDKELLDAAVSAHLAGHETQLTETNVAVTDEGITVVNGQSGKKADREKLEELIVSEFAKSERKEIEVSFVVTAPSETDCDNLLDPLISSYREAEYIKDENGNITVTEDVPGVVLDKTEAVKIMKEHTTEGESYVIPCQVQLSKYTKEYLEECLFKDNLASYSSSFATSGANRSSNVILAANTISGTVLMPGDVFSFNSALGERTVANGYKTAGAYVGGKTVDQVGGGICQVSSTLYNTVLLSNLEIVERRSHQMVVGYVPQGRDATVNWGTTDFRFKNNTDFPVKIVSEINGKNVKISMLGTKTIPNMEVKIETETVSVLSPAERYVEDPTLPAGTTKKDTGKTGYVVASTRVVYSNGAEIKREKLTNSRYNPTDTVITVGTMELPTEAVQTAPETPATSGTPADEEMPAWLIPSN